MLERKDIRRILRILRREGAVCSKDRRRGYWSCVKDNTEVRIFPDKITVHGLVDWEGLYLFLEDEKRTIDDFLNDLKNATDAEEASLDYPVGGASFILEYNSEKWRKAIETFRKISRNDLWMAIRNVHGEIILYKGEEPVDAKDWINVFKRRR